MSNESQAPNVLALMKGNERYFFFMMMRVGLSV